MRTVMGVSGDEKLSVLLLIECRHCNKYQLDEEFLPTEFWDCRNTSNRRAVAWNRNSRGILRLVIEYQAGSLE